MKRTNVDGNNLPIFAPKVSNEAFLNGSRIISKKVHKKSFLRAISHYFIVMKYYEIIILI